MKYRYKQGDLFIYGGGLLIVLLIVLALAAFIRSGIRDESSACPDGTDYDPMYEVCTPMPDIPRHEEFPEQP